MGSREDRGMAIWGKLLFISSFCQEDTPEEAESRPQRPKSFQQKREYFQKMGKGAQGGSHVINGCL